MSIKILATADLHLGKTSADVQDSHNTTKYTWLNIVDWCIANDVDVLALCGDIIDRDNRFFEAVGPFQDGLEKLGQHHIEVFVVSGNHDYDVLPAIIRSRGFEHVHLLGANGTWEMLKFSKNDEMIQFIGWSFPRLIVKESAMINWLLYGHDPNYPVIGLLHGDVDNVESNYNPFRLNDLVKNEVDLWILGHIHKPDQLRQHSPQIWYTGSPHALSSKEPGKHGPMLFTIDANKHIKTERVLLSPVRYERLDIDVASCEDETQLRDRILTLLREDAERKLEDLERVWSLVYQVTLFGRHSHIKHVEQWVTNLTDLDIRLDIGTHLSVRKVTCNLTAEIENMEELAGQSSLAGILAQTILAIKKETTTPFLEGLIEEWYKKAQLVSDSGTYQPLVRHKKIEALSEEIAKNYILNECNRLLGELTDQLKGT